MGSNSSKMSHVKTIKVETARTENEFVNKRINHFDAGPKKEDEPVAYRDKDGTVQVYNKEEVPVVWVPTDTASIPKEVDSVKDITLNDLKDGANDVKRQTSAKTSKSEGHVPHSVKLSPESDSKPAVKEGFVSPTRVTPNDVEKPGPSNQAITDAKPAKNTEYTLFRDGTFVQGAVKAKDSEGGPEFKPPSITRRDLIPEEDMFEDIDEHVLQTPKVVKEDISSLVSYLTKPACTPLDEVRAFYIWITHNINYDTSGYFGRSQMMSTDPESVLKTRLTVCEGYAKLLQAFCKKVAIPTKIIKGYVKGFGYQPGDDVSKEAHNAHMWNAVYVENNWFLIDVTLGAGYVKSKEKTYVAKFNPLYFICDPVTFISDHFPYVKDDSMNERNQLLDKPIKFEDFCLMLNIEKCGKEWGIDPISHRIAVIKDVKFELDIQLQQTHTPMSDYIAFLYRDNQKLDQFTYTQKIDLRTVKIHVLLPSQGDLALQIYGRRKQDPPNSNLEPLVRYILKCSTGYDNPTPYPTHHTLYGLVDDPEKYDLKDVGNVYNEAKLGEAILKLKPVDNAKSDFSDLLPRMFYGDHTTELTTQTFIEYSEDFQYLNIRARVPFKGYFKLVLFGKPLDGAKLRPFMTYLIENKRVVNEEGFPIAHAHALKYKCRLVEPLRRKLASGQNNSVLVNVKSPVLVKVKAHETVMTKSDDVTFEGLVNAPKLEDSDFIIYGADKDDGSYHPLYTCTLIPSNILSVPSAIKLPISDAISKKSK